MWSSRCATRRYVSSGPDTAMVRPPALITLALPLTGAARNSTPRSAHAVRIAADVSVETVEQSMTISGRVSSTSRPPSPSSTCSRSVPVETIVKTTSRSRSSAIDVAILPPAAATRAGLVGGGCSDLAARGRHRLGLVRGAVPDGEVLAGVGDAYCHRPAHPPGSDPADPQGGPVSLCFSRHRALLFAIVCSQNSEAPKPCQWPSLHSQACAHCDDANHPGVTEHWGLTTCGSCHNTDTVDTANDCSKE